MKLEENQSRGHMKSNQKYAEAFQKCSEAKREFNKVLN